MSTVFLGTSDFAAAVLERLAASERHRPVLVLTRPDRPSGRGRRLRSPPVAVRARELGLPVQQPEKINSHEVVAAIAASADPPPTVVVCAFGALIAEPLLCAQDILNVHPSLLPRWRGAAPIERAIMAGDSETGVSIMRLTEGLDSGPVCLAAAEPIGPREDYGSLAARLQELGASLLLRALEERPSFHEQDETGVTYAEKIGPEDRVLRPTQPAQELDRVVRALHPHIGARLPLDSEQALGVLRAQVVADRAPTGRLVQEGQRLLLGCLPGTLELLEVKPPGGRAMGAGEYLRGHGPPGRA